MNRGIAVAGNMIVDYNKVIRVFPERNGLVKIDDVFTTLGGAVNNVIQDLARMDPELPLKAIGLVGEDGEGQLILDTLRGYPNIDTSRILREGRTSFTDVLAEAESKVRSFLVYAGSNAAFGLQHVDFDKLDCDIFHIGYILLLDELDSFDDEYGTKMARLLNEVSRRGIQTSVDVVSEVSDRYKKLVPPSLRHTDYLIINEIEAGKTAGIEVRAPDGGLDIPRVRRALHALKEMGVRRWVIIHSPEGGFGLDERDNFVSAPSYDLPDGFIAATVGAGDAFCAGALYSAYGGADLHEAIAYANMTAAASLTRANASDGVCPPSEMRALTSGLPLRELNV